MMVILQQAIPVRDSIAQGRSIAETMGIAQDVARKLIDSYIEHGVPLPHEIKPSEKVIQDVKIPIILTARDIIRKLRKAGFVFYIQAKGSHEIGYNPTTKRNSTVKIVEVSVWANRFL